MTERNNALLARVDERTESILREHGTFSKDVIKTLDEIKQHLIKLNGSVSKNTTSCGENRSHINIQWWLIGGVITALVLKFTGVF